jgi:molybdate transport system permease protein
MSEFAAALFMSLRVAIMATLLVAAMMIPLAFVMARREFPGKAFLETLLTVPLVLPPTVVGYCLIAFLGVQSAIGQTLDHLFGWRLLFTTEGAVIASAVVSLPLLYLPAKAAFETIEHELEDIAKLMGASPFQIFWHVSLPIARRGIGSGILLAFSRALGEFGATVMILGISPSRQTLPIKVYLDYVDTGTSGLNGAVIVLIAISFLMIGLYNRAARRE